MPLPPLGLHTVHEMKNLWDAYAFEFAQLGKAIARGAKSWAAKDPQGFASFIADWDKLSSSFVAETEAANRTMGIASAGSTPSWDYVPAVDPEFPLGGDEFIRILAVFATGRPVTGVFDTQWDIVPGPGGFDDLDRRFRASPVGSMAPSYQGIPQPDAPDLELKAYQLSDQAMKSLEKVGNAGLGVLGVVLVGGALYIVGRLLGRR